MNDTKVRIISRVGLSLGMLLWISISGGCVVGEVPEDDALWQEDGHFSTQSPGGFGAVQGLSALGNPEIIALAAGGTTTASHTLALVRKEPDRTFLFAWGSDASGQLGNGHPLEDSGVPLEITSLRHQIAVPVSPNAPTIAAGGRHSLAVLANGTIAAWGADNWGQLGNGNPRVDLSSPDAIGIALPSGKAARVVAAGRNHSLAIDEDGLVFAWGDNRYGQLGFGTLDAAGVVSPPFIVDPIQVLGLSGPAASIAAGATHSRRSRRRFTL